MCKPLLITCGSLRYIIKVLSTEAKIVNTLRLISESTKNSFQHTIEHYLQTAFTQLNWLSLMQLLGFLWH